MRELLDQLRNRQSRRSEPDSLRRRQLEARLARLAHEMLVLDAEITPRFALGHHARAAVLAYDRTLTEACELAGLPVPEGDGPVDRLLNEANLLKAGWRW